MSETMSEYSSVSGWGSLEKNNIFLLLQIVPSNDLMVLVHHMCDVTQRIQQETCWVEIWHQNFLSRIELTNTTVDSEMPQGPKLIKNSMYIYIYISLSLSLSLFAWVIIYLASFSSQDLQVISHVQRPSIFGQVGEVHLIQASAARTQRDDWRVPDLMWPQCFHTGTCTSCS